MRAFRGALFSPSAVPADSGIGGCSCPRGPGPQQHPGGSLLMLRHSRNKAIPFCKAAGERVGLCKQRSRPWHWKMRTDQVFFFCCCCCRCDLQQNLKLTVVWSILPVNLLAPLIWVPPSTFPLCQSTRPSAGAHFRAFFLISAFIFSKRLGSILAHFYMRDTVNSRNKQHKFTKL